MRVRMELAYDGTPFHGFAYQSGLPTIGGALEDTIEHVTGHRPTLTCAGRTDAGVHARAQVISFDLPDDTTVELEQLQWAINKLRSPSISVASAEAVDEGFDARFSAVSRRYRYTVVNRRTPDPFLANTAWWIRQPLDVRALVLGCDPLFGEHDFSSFCRRPPKGGLRRRVLDAGWEEAGDGVLHFWIEANAFCHQMVRSIVATLVDVGRRRCTAGDVLGIMRSGDRNVASPPAPPHGLCLWSVRYEGDDRSFIDV